VADHSSSELMIDSVQLESSPTVLSCLETVVSLAVLLLPSVRRPVTTTSPRVDQSFSRTNVVCVQATNLNVFLCCENSGQLLH